MSNHKNGVPEHLHNSGTATRVLHADRQANSSSAVSPPIYQTATFRASSARDFAERASRPRHSEFYTRYGNPNHRQVEAVVASLEGAESALVTASGTAAATTAVLAFAGAGDHVVAQTNHYGGTSSFLREMLPRFGVEVTLVDQADSEAFERALRPNTRLIIIETPANPVMKITDLQAVASIARAHKVLTLADNTVATPINQRPLDRGIDLVFHSATKYFGGHSDISAGLIAGSEALLERIWKTHVLLGATLGPFDAWLMLRGLRTLPLRVRQHNSNALAVARFLERHPVVKVVHYPGLESHPQHELARRQMSGFGGLLSFELQAGASPSAFLAALRLSDQAPSLGGVETLGLQPAALFAHYMDPEQAARAGIPAGMLRFSIGLEDEHDLLADFEQALAAAETGCARVAAQV